MPVHSRFIENSFEREGSRSYPENADVRANLRHRLDFVAKPMTQLLSEVPLDAAAIKRLQALPGVAVRQFPAHGPEWDLPDDLLREPEILLCKFPPRNLDGMTNLRLMQLSTVGYEHLRHLGLADRPLR